ncbi:hypothetical protein NDU88_003006 [Pleurodeles waltl]|uniref:Uncharacterized protein n=1 Tax=Pleurodeles waltl TaxID=8319 RepID=A0AAV7LE13_PLEWA|nr:hypothetical protein NDU88_003006 [Pleurodeles waltl]
MTPWRLQPLHEAPALISPSSGSSCKNSPKTKRLESGRCGDPSNRTDWRPGARDFFLWPPNQREAEPRRGTIGGRHLAFETGARIELSGSAVRTVRSAGSPVCPQCPEAEPAPGGYGARGTAESLVRTQFGWSYRAEESRAHLWPPETTGGGKSERRQPGQEAKNQIGGAPRPGVPGKLVLEIPTRRVEREPPRTPEETSE